MRSDGFAGKPLASSLLSSPTANRIFSYQPGLVLLALLLMASTMVGGEEQCDLAKGGACLGGMRVNWLVHYELLTIQLLDINWKLRMVYPLPKPINTNLSFIMILGWDTYIYSGRCPCRDEGGAGRTKPSTKQFDNFGGATKNHLNGAGDSNNILGVWPSKRLWRISHQNTFCPSASASASAGFLPCWHQHSHVQRSDRNEFGKVIYTWLPKSLIWNWPFIFPDCPFKLWTYKCSSLADLCHLRGRKATGDESHGGCPEETLRGKRIFHYRLQPEVATIAKNRDIDKQFCLYSYPCNIWSPKVFYINLIKVRANEKLQLVFLHDGQWRFFLVQYGASLVEVITMIIIIYIIIIIFGGDYYHRHSHSSTRVPLACSLVLDRNIARIPNAVQVTNCLLVSTSVY